jgi:hypothetical protein
VSNAKFFLKRGCVLDTSTFIWEIRKFCLGYNHVGWVQADLKELCCMVRDTKRCHGVF